MNGLGRSSCVKRTRPSAQTWLVTLYRGKWVWKRRLSRLSRPRKIQPYRASTAWFPKRPKISSSKYSFISIDYGSFLAMPGWIGNMTVASW